MSGLVRALLATVGIDVVAASGLLALGVPAVPAVLGAYVLGSCVGGVLVGRAIRSGRRV